MMPVMQLADLDSIRVLIIDALRFPAHGVLDAGGGHEVAFIGGVDEFLSRVGLPAEGRDRGDARLPS
jgi:hypothetical protein